MMLTEIGEKMPIVFVGEYGGAEIYMLREDLRHPGMSGNKFWKLLLPVRQYLESKPTMPHLITFGGAYSNHIAATAYLGHQLKIQTTGYIRGEELSESFHQNPTLAKASALGMHFQFISREQYRQREDLLKMISEAYPGSLIIPEGGSLPKGAEGVAGMLTDQTHTFDYLCTPVGTGTTLVGLQKGAASHQKIMGVAVVKDSALPERIAALGGTKELILWDGSFGGYGKFNEQIIKFINDFYRKTNISLDPVYSGKMMKVVLDKAQNGEFPVDGRVLCIHTGGLQGILGANELLKKKNRTQIEFRFV